MLVQTKKNWEFFLQNNKKNLGIFQIVLLNVFVVLSIFCTPFLFIYVMPSLFLLLSN